MARSAMKVISVLACMVLLSSVLAEGQPNGPKPKKVKCQDKNYPTCYHVKMLCPDACPRKCEVDCVTCQPVCSLPLPSPSTPPTYTTPPSSPVSTPSPPPPQTLTPSPISTPPSQSPPKLTPPTASTPPSPPTPSQSPPKLTPPPASTPPSPPAPSQSPPKLTPPTASTPPSPPTPSQSPPNLTPPPASTPPSPPAPSQSPPKLTPPPTLTPPSSSVPIPPVVTPPTLPTPSPPTNWPPKVSGQSVYCKNKNYPKCYRMEQRCPAACPDQCVVDCVTCSPVCNCNRPGAVCQDPRFIGADGITFYFHGKKDSDFCIVSDSNLHINAHFIGKRNKKMKRDFTWVQSLGILFDNNQIFIGAKKTPTWNNAIDRLDLAFNGQPIFLSESEGAKWELPITPPGVSITRSKDTNAVVIEVEGNFQIKATVVPVTQKDSEIHKYGITEEDCFAHLDLSFKFYSLTGEVNGVLGQTYASNYVSRVKMGVDMPVLGGDKEFASSNLFSTDCAVARFSGTALISNNFEYANLKCVSGLNGRGVVCKR